MTEIQKPLKTQVLPCSTNTRCRNAIGGDARLFRVLVHPSGYCPACAEHTECTVGCPEGATHVSHTGESHRHSEDQEASGFGTSLGPRALTKESRTSSAIILSQPSHVSRVSPKIQPQREMPQNHDINHCSDNIQCEAHVHTSVTIVQH